NDDAEPLMKLARHHFALNEPLRADEYISKKVKLHRDAGEVDSAVSTLVDAAEYLAADLKDKESARAYWERALKLCHEICTPTDEADMLIRVGKDVDRLAAQEQVTIEYFERAARIHREHGDHETEARALTEASQWFEL